MRAQLAGVVAGTVDQRRFTPPQELCPHKINTGGRNDSPVVADQPLTVEYR